VHINSWGNKLGIFRILKSRSPGLWCHVVLQYGMNILEDLAASIFTLHTLMQHCTMSQPRRRPIKSSPLCKPQILHILSSDGMSSNNVCCPYNSSDKSGNKPQCVKCVFVQLIVTSHCLLFVCLGINQLLLHTITSQRTDVPVQHLHG